MPLDYRKDRRYSHLSLEQVRKHYEVEKELRQVLLDAPPGERNQAFLFAYDELFRRVPWHPALTETSGLNAADLIATRVKKISRFIPTSQNCSVLEIGCGMGELLIGLSRSGYQCTGIDVSETRIAQLKRIESPNLVFYHTEGTNLPFEDSQYSVVISMQLFEHLHPEDALRHLKEVNRVLKPNGRYLLETPNRLVGPGDISRFFTESSEGFHLKEYSVRDLIKLFREAGYGRVQVATWYRRIIPETSAKIIESLWSLFPKSFRQVHSFGLHNPLYIAEK